MCFGGPDIDYPDPVDPMREAQAQMLLRQEEARLAQEQLKQQRAYQEQQEQQRLNRFNTALDTGYNTALQYARGQIGDYGLNEQEFLPRIQSELAYLRGTANPYYTADPTQLFSEASIDNIFNQEQERLRRQYGNQLDEFAPTGFARTAIPGTADDAIIDAILSEQRSGAEQQIFNQFQRGQLTEPAYNFALSQLDNVGTGARAQLQGIGQGILEEGRGSLRDLASEARQGAQNYQLGSSFDPGYYQGLFDTTRDEFTGNLEGRLRSAIGDQQFFDVDSILARAGTFQGPQNTPNNADPNGAGVPDVNRNPVLNPNQGGFGQPGVFSAPQGQGQQQQDGGGLAAALADRNRDSKKTASRGLGSKGVF